MTKKVITAIKASIKHWERDIVGPLEKGKKIEYYFDIFHWDTPRTPEVKCTSEYCPLCNLFQDGYCEDCPLKTCDEGSTWQKFASNPCLKTARAMVRKLKSLLPKEER